MKYTDIKQDGCPFCKLAFANWWEKEFQSFFIVANKAPYAKGIDHGLIIPKRHLHKRSDLNFSEKMNLESIQSKLAKTFESLMFIERNGTPEQSIHHFHVHFMTDDRWMVNGIPEDREFDVKTKFSGDFLDKLINIK